MSEFGGIDFFNNAGLALSRVYEGLDPLTADDVADCVLFAVTGPLRVDVGELVVKALARSTGHRIVRQGAQGT